MAAAETAAYLGFLNAYADEQHKLGRFVDSTRNNHVVDVKQWLKQNKVVPQDSKIFVYVSIGFLLVCLINALGLMQAKFLRLMIGEGMNNFIIEYNEQEEGLTDEEHMRLL